MLSRKGGRIHRMYYSVLMYLIKTQIKCIELWKSQWGWILLQDSVSSAELKGPTACSLELFSCFILFIFYFCQCCVFCQTVHVLWLFLRSILWLMMISRTPQQDLRTFTNTSKKQVGRWSAGNQKIMSHFSPLNEDQAEITFCWYLLLLTRDVCAHATDGGDLHLWHNY